MSQRPWSHALRRGALLCVVGTLSTCASTAEQSRTKDGLRPIAGLSPASVDAAARPRKVALLVGIDAFVDPFWPALRFAAKDASDLAQLLRAPEIGDFDQVEVMVSPQETTRAQVWRAIDRLRALAPRPEDTVVLYISSHGTLAPAPRGQFHRVLVMSDTQQAALETTALVVSDLVQAFDALPSQRKAMVLATCHSGGGKSLLTPAALRALEGIKGGPPALERVSRATLIFSAAEFGQPAREDDRLRNDVYTHFLLMALSLGADANGDGAVSATEAHDYARRHTFEFTDGAQVPTVQSSVTGADPVILAGAVERPGLPVLYSYAAGLDGYSVTSDGRDKGILPGTVVLESGSQRLSITRGDDVAFSGHVDLAAGERVDVEAIINRAQPRLAVGLRLGGWSLLDPGLVNTTVAPLGGPTLALRARDLPWRHLDPVLDLSFGYGEQRVRPGEFEVAQDVWSLRLGVGAALATDLAFTRIYGGPHLSLLYLDRTVRARAPFDQQRFATIMPGAVAGVAAAYSQLELQLELQLHYLPLLMGDELRSVATGSVSAGVGYRF